jgi:hypothetical protein
MAAAEKAVGLLNKVDTKVLLIGGAVIVGGIAAYELLKGTTSSASQGPTSATQQQNPSQSLGSDTQSAAIPNNISPSFTLTPNSTYSLTPSQSVNGNHNYTITSVYAPNNAETLTNLYAPTTTTSTNNETSLKYAPYNYQATSTANNQKYQYQTGGIGSGLNLNSKVNSGLYNWLTGGGT